MSCTEQEKAEWLAELVGRAGVMPEPLERMRYHSWPATEEDPADWELFPRGTECKDCIDVVILSESSWQEAMAALQAKHEQELARITHEAASTQDVDMLPIIVRSQG